MATDNGGDDLLRDVARAVGDEAGPVYVGFSGGLDSTVLLHVAVSVVAQSPSVARICALHVNHGLHAAADAWEQRCGAVAARLGIDFVARRVSIPRRGSLEARARAARYAVFAEFLDASDRRLLLAHHRDDQAETVLLRLLQGRGVYGMPAARRLGAGMVLRPLLDHPRSHLLAFARSAGLAWLDDPANADLAIDRNFVRHRILPELRTRFAEVDGALVRAIATRAADEQQLCVARGLDPTTKALPLEILFASVPSEQRVLLRLWLAAHGRSIPAARALDEFVTQLHAGSDRRPCLELDCGALRRYRDHVWLCGPRRELADVYPVTVPGELVLPHGRLVIGSDPEGFACHGEVVVRFRTGGEHIRSGGRSRSVKALFQDAELPPWLRASYPLVCDARGLVAVPGLAVRDSQTTDSAPRYRAEWLPDA